MFDNLSNRLEKIFSGFRRNTVITEANISDTVKEIRRALVDADVHYKIAKEFTDTVKEKAIGRKIVAAVSPGQMLVKIIQEELTILMGSEKQDLHLHSDTNIIMVVGLQGSGKTTFCGKLANRFKSQGRQVLLIAADVYRPGAIDQLQTLGDTINVEVYAEKGNKNVLEIAKKGIAFGKEKGKKTIIVDTAGRLGIDNTMMTEIETLKHEIHPQETLFVVDSMTGQDAVNTAKAFHDRIQFDGVVLTKLDADTRGGAALSIKTVVNKPIKFISNGEKMDALDIFYPDRMAQRILGMGDIVSLVEKAEQVYDKEQEIRLNKRIKNNTFGFDDLLDQIKSMRKMGGMKSMIGMIPGLPKISKEDLDNVEGSFIKKTEAIILSMTPQERRNPQLIDNISRKKRIAKGSGTDITEVNKAIKQLEQLSKMMKHGMKMR
ncbi:MAG: signal recognition particle protein [Chitinophagaceae bacterium]|nr:signal recognition particle protein [Chitinophagaceae bacterium]